MKFTNPSLMLLAASLAFSACSDDDSNPPVVFTNNGTNNTTNNSNNSNNATNNSNNATNNSNNTTNNGTNNTTNNDVPGTCAEYCDKITMNCSGENEQFGSRDACIDYCENIGSWDAGLTSDTEGNTIGCRTYHADGPASADPAAHCGHAGPSGGGVCGTYCENYCQLSANTCTGANALYASDAACATACAGFASTGSPGDAEYDTVQCRIYHAGAPAAADPALHCSHAAENPNMFCLGQPTDFRFRTDAPSAYTRVDRMGMPAVSTALIASKDAYNDDNPTDDVAGTYVSEIVATLNFLHGALDTQLSGLSLTPCSMADANNDTLPDCVGQAVVANGPTVAGLVLPDTLKIDPSAAAGFPNGRRLQDPVIDVTLSVILLDMSVHGPTALVGTNPTANDLGVEGAFLTTFPYLHPPHRP